MDNGWRVPYGVSYPRHLRVVRRAPRPIIIANEQAQNPSSPAPDIGAESTTESAAYKENLLRMKKISEDMKMIRQAGAKKTAASEKH